MTQKAGVISVSLESLGLTLSNVPSQFRMNQQETENTETPSMRDSFVFISDIGSDDSGSIVVLGNTSLDVVRTQTLAKYAEIQQKSMEIDCQSIISSLTVPEIEQKLTEVLQENARLKETLENNNSSTKQVLHLLASKQSEVSWVHEEHKRQFAETKNLVNVLRAENSEYKIKIDELMRERVNCSPQNVESIPLTTLDEKSDGWAITMVMEKSEKQEEEIRRLNEVVASLEKQLESTREADEELSRIHEEQKRELTKSNDLVKVLTSEIDKYKTKIEDLNKERTNRSMQTEAQDDQSTASPVFNEKADESEVKKLTEKCKQQDLEMTRMRAIIASLERQLVAPKQNIAENGIQGVQPAPISQEESKKLKELLENARRAHEKVKLALGNEILYMTRERTRLEEAERTLVEANVALHEDAVAMREANQALNVQLAYFEEDWAEQTKLCESMRQKENELLERVEKLENEKEQLLATIQYIEES